MTLNNNQKKYACPPNAFFRPSLFRVVFLPISLAIGWAAAFFKTRAAETWPWLALLLVTVFVLGVVVAEALVSAYFARYLAPAIFGFLAGAGVNVIFQGLLGKFQGLTWAFENPIFFSLGMLLFGFLGSLIFISHGQKVRKIFISLVVPEKRREDKGHFRFFSAIIWAITMVIAIILFIALVIIQKEFSSFETGNPLRKPLWFSAGFIVLIFVIVYFTRKNLLRLGRILLPGVVVGLIWAYIVRDIFEGVYLAFPKFPIASEALELLLVINFCFLGIAWLNKAAEE